MIDQLIETLSMVCGQLLPILGAAVLIYLILFLKKGIEFLQECTGRMKQLESTVKGVDESIEKIQAPLDTAVKMSHTVDRLHDSTEAALKQAVSFVAENFGSIRDNLVKSKPASEAGAEEGLKAKDGQKTEGEDWNV